jgi:hypothetical protein
MVISFAGQPTRPDERLLISPADIHPAKNSRDRKDTFISNGYFSLVSSNYARQAKPWLSAKADGICRIRITFTRIKLTFANRISSAGFGTLQPLDQSSISGGNRTHEMKN